MIFKSVFIKFITSSLDFVLVQKISFESGYQSDYILFTYF